jgi:hypothetical protein
MPGGLWKAQPSLERCRVGARFPSDKEARMLRPILTLSTLVIAVALQASLFGHVGAQSASGSTGCVDATQKPATDDAKGPDSGSKNMGVTGWSGGDRQPSSDNKAERDQKGNETGQPATAKGLDPTKDKGTGTC